MRRHLSITNFLHLACAHWVSKDFDVYQNAEREKWHDAAVPYNPDLAIANYIRRLRARLTEDDVDEGFKVPATYEEFHEADTWAPNDRPVRASRQSP